MSKIAFVLSIYFINSFAAIGQAEFEPWGNLRGIRVDGQLMELETNLSVVKDWNDIKATAKERQRPGYNRKGAKQVVTTKIDSLYITETVEDTRKGTATFAVRLTAREALNGEGVFVALLLPITNNRSANLQIDHFKPRKVNGSISHLANYLKTPARKLHITMPGRNFMIAFDEPTLVVARPVKERDQRVVRIFIPVKAGSMQVGDSASKSFSITASGAVDTKPVSITLNTAITGRTFDGFGGNFRLQNPTTDPQVIDYCLTNMRVAWGRVEMPWRLWQPAIDTNPVTAAKSGKLHPHVQRSMEMAQRLNKLGMPVIVSAWTAPNWAIVGTPRFQPDANGQWGNPLDHSKNKEIYQSIADYLVYLKDEYGVQVSMFSFNESDLGINVRQTGEEHAQLIRELGAYFQSRGLQTKLLLGDNSDATTYHFIEPALNDPMSHPFIGAISFHSWRGWETETLKQWADAADKIQRPLLVGEGSIDAQAWGYPPIFEEQTYALQEVDLYIRLLSICQPASILQWQLTADYSPLVGGGIFGDSRPLQPTQRFWNLKQLASTPKQVKAMQVKTGGRYISVAALGNNDSGLYTIHIVNMGPTRQATVTGLPKKIKSLRIFVTDKKRPMDASKRAVVVNGVAKFTMDETSFITLINE